MHPYRLPEICQTDLPIAVFVHSHHDLVQVFEPFWLFSLHHYTKNPLQSLALQRIQDYSVDIIYCFLHGNLHIKYHQTAEGKGASSLKESSEKSARQIAADGDTMLLKELHSTWMIGDGNIVNVIEVHGFCQRRKYLLKSVNIVI
jgi:hypothetical protein